MATNEHGLDARYFKEKLGQLVRDADNYEPREMKLALDRLSEVARSQISPMWKCFGPFNEAHAKWAAKEVVQNMDGKVMRFYREKEEIDPTPWCHACGSMTQDMCQCGPIAEND
jgi:hypothetical protein